MSIPKFTKTISCAVPLNIENIDTDQIIPARFLKAVERKGFGDNLFRDWRFDKSGNTIDEFALCNPSYTGTILVAGKNFGCGSSREHAAWAIFDYGFRVVVSSFFADIFRNNALNNGLLPIQVTESFLSDIFSAVETNPSTELIVDLNAQTITISSTGKSECFVIDSYKKECLLNGYDDIDFLTNLKPEIENFEKTKRYEF